MPYFEIQKFNKKLLLIISIVIAIMPLIGLFQQLVLGKPFGSKPATDTQLIIITGALFLLILGVFKMTLKTTINNQGIYVRFFPFIYKFFPWAQIKSATVITYNFVGWGIRLFTKYGTIYNTKGNKGLALTLNNGKQFLIGTQHPKKVATYVDKYLK